MNINELKIGDRVKYKKEQGICGTNQSIIHEYEGNILERREEYGGFFQITKDNYHNNQISVKFNDIISKLEPLPPQYKEIPIEKEEINFKKELEERLKLRTIKEESLLQELSDGIKKVIDIAKKAEYSLNDLINKKEKSAPQSFKFDAYLTDNTMNRPYNRDTFTIKGIASNENGTFNFIFDGFMSCPINDFNKTYTIEIKEKNNIND